MHNSLSSIKINQLNDRITDLTTQVEELEKINDELHDYCEDLELLVKALQKLCQDIYMNGVTEKNQDRFELLAGFDHDEPTYGNEII